MSSFLDIGSSFSGQIAAPEGFSSLWGGRFVCSAVQADARRILIPQGKRLKL
jgi:hypothetical protein